MIAEVPTRPAISRPTTPPGTAPGLPGAEPAGPLTAAAPGIDDGAGLDAVGGVDGPGDAGATSGRASAGST